MTLLIKYLIAGLGLFALNPCVHAQISFSSATNYSVGTSPASVVAVDVNGDGKVDLISVNQGDHTLTVLTNNGSGGFGSNATLNVGTVGSQPVSLTTADVNGDGKVDLICANSGISPDYIGTLTILTNNGSGGFVLKATMNLVPPSTPVVSVTTADIYGDGKMALICANANYNTLTVLTNDGNGNFATKAILDVYFGGNYNPFSVLAVDVNGDGKVDLISVDTASMNGDAGFTVLTNNGSGDFIFCSAPSSGYGAAVAADVNGDGKVDLIRTIPDDNNSLQVLTNDGSGGFVLSSSQFLPEPDSITAADVNGDGKVDLISTGNNGLYVLTNNGTGGFMIAATLVVSNPVSVIAADVNGDGRLDLISANYGNTLSVLTNSLTFLPNLALKGSSNNVVVSWPSQWTGWAGWTLQQNTDLKTTNWTGFNGIIGDDGINKTVTNSPPTGNLFFRLMHM